MKTFRQELRRWARIGEGELAPVLRPESSPLSPLPINEGSSLDALSQVQRSCLMAALCHAAYHPPDRVTPWLASHGCRVVEFLEVDGARCLIVDCRDEIVLAFCGTRPDAIETLLDDGDIRLVSLGPGRVHRGFLRHWQRLDEQVRGVIGSRACWLTGHSLGAAVALHAARALSLRGPVTVFGCPRPGDRRALALWKGVPIHRWQNGSDIVGHLPPQWTGLHHPGTLHFLCPSGSVVIDPPWWRFKGAQMLGEAAYAVGGHWWHRGRMPLRWLADHAISAYVRILERRSCAER